MAQKEWNRKGKRKGLVCFSITDIAKIRGVSNAAIYQARKRGILDLNDIESVARYTLDKSGILDSIEKQEKPTIKKTTAESLSSLGIKLSGETSKELKKPESSYTKPKALNKDEEKINTGKEIYKKYKEEENTQELAVTLEKLGVRCRDRGRLLKGEIDTVEMNFDNIAIYGKKWAAFKVPIYGFDED